jgi:anaerobic dimethyl sulfoxide reductase subunit C (anchor subunit)
MELREWALIAYTILAQMSVGAFLVLGLVHFYVARKTDMAEADRMSDRAWIAVIVTLGLGMVASLFHLGNIANAPRAVTNFATSWLSREILLGVIFAVLGIIFVALQWFKVGPFLLRNIIAWITALVGLVLVYSMSQIYMLPTQPAWNTLATPITFFVTTLLLGALAIGVALVVNYAIVKKREPGCADAQCELLRAILRWIAVASVILVGIEFVVIPVYMGYLASSGSAEALASAKLIVGQFSLIFILRLLLAFIGAGVFGVFLYQNATSPGKEKVMGYLAYAAFALVLTAEVMG